MTTEISLPDLCVVALVGASSSGKSTFAARVFRGSQVLSSDFFRGLVRDDENDQSASADAFDALYYVAGKRLAAGKLTVVDATNVQPDSRKQVIALAREHDVLPIAIVLDPPEAVLMARNAGRPDRMLAPAVVRRQRDQLRRSLRTLEREGFRHVHVLRSVEEIDAATVTYHRLRNDFRHETGPFDVVGDVHGCRAELEALLDELGWTVVRDELGRPVDAVHAEGRTLVLVGDLVDRGPDSPGVLRLAMGMVAAGHAFVVPGNHENKLVRALRGRDVQGKHGLAETLAQLEQEPPEFRAAVERFCYDLVSHLVLDGGRLVVAHAGLPERMHGRASARVRAFALYGETTGETDEFGLPVRYAWANDYRGRATVLYGHTPVPAAEWVNNTLCLDTGCVFGGRLTALRWPERELVSVPAHQVWWEPVRPLLPDATAESPRAADLLDVADVLGAGGVQTRLRGRVTVREGNAAAALEVMSRFAVDPRWLLYLPPTMAPCATSSLPGLLEHPVEAFATYRADGVREVVCEEKHMGSRAVVLVCRDEHAARQRFGATDGATGAVYTRTGRAFFERERTEQLLGRVRAAAEQSGLWDELGATWLLLDAELMPWSVKAEELLRDQYAAVGAAARAALPAAVAALQAAAARGLDVTEPLRRTESRLANAERFVTAYRRYCWPTDGLAGVRLAPFQLLATDTATFHDRDHSWHLATLDRLVAAAPDLVTATRRVFVDVTDEHSVAAGTAWWEELTAAGGEGMVVKPLGNVVQGARGLAQPGVKCRGPEYLRIIYGPDYTEPVHLDRLRQRNLGHKRSLALREWALGVESLERAVAGEPLWRVHECVFAVLALESEPVDPRL